MSWDREGDVVAVDGVIPAMIMLDVSSEITGVTDFSFVIVIEGTE